MELITLTADIRRMFGITSAIVNYQNKDYMIMLKQMSDNYIVFTMPEIEISYGEILLVKFPSNYGTVEIKISVNCFYSNGSTFVIEADFIVYNESDFFMEFEKFIRLLLEEKKRKEERILCTKRNLELLNLKNIIELEFKYKKMKAVIKDLSYSGIKLLCNEKLLEDTSLLFNFKLFFFNPNEVILFFNCPIIRKSLFVFEEQKMTELVLKLPENIKYKKRIGEFLSNNESKTHLR